MSPFVLLPIFGLTLFLQGLTDSLSFYQARGATHSFFDMAGEDVNLKVLRTAVALSETEAVTL